MKKLLKKLFKEEKGQGLVEYALIIALVSIVAVAVLKLLGKTINDIFGYIVTTLDDAI